MSARARVAIIDYGRGNLRSVANAVAACGAAPAVTADAEAIDDASHIILPGVGAFGPAMEALNARGLVPVLARAVREKAKPFLGICLGMQLLATRGLEDGEHVGLGWIEGDIVKLEPGLDRLKIPHMGWNSVALAIEHPLFAGIQAEQRSFYFAHSYCLRETAAALATCDYGATFAAAVARDNVLGVQFHPEKSQDSGLALLRNFVGWKP